MLAVYLEASKLFRICEEKHVCGKTCREIHLTGYAVKNITHC